MLQLKKEVSQNRTKLQQTTKQQNKTTNDHFSAKNKQSIFETNFTKFEGKVRFGQIFFENDPLDELNQMPLSKKFHLFRKLVKNAKKWSKSNLPLSHSPDRKMFPFKKGFKKCGAWRALFSVYSEPEKSLDILLLLLLLNTDYNLHNSQINRG